MRTTSFLAAAGAAALAVASSAQAAYDFTAKPVLAALGSCTPQQPGTSAPQVDAARTNMTKADISIAAWTKPVTNRKMVMYLGKDATSNTCFADSLGSAADCRYDFSLKGTWQGLRGCGWSGPDTVSRPGYEVRNNTVYLEWQDQFPGGNRQTSRYAYPVSIALPTTVNVQTNVKILEDSGIKNFNLTGMSYETSGDHRYLILDFQMYSRWPNNLTLDGTTGLTLPGYPGVVTVDNYVQPTCVKTDGSSSSVYTTNDFCYQNGQVRIDIGQQCDVGGTYAFNFDTDCFPNSNQNNCKGKVLSANALIGSSDGSSPALHLDLCNALYNTVAKVTGQMVADKPNGYFFGDTITLTATFNSPDLPIYESRLTNLVLGRNTVQRTPNIGAATNVTRDHNTTLVNSAAGPSATGALSTLAVNTAFQYTPGSDTVVMKLTPNMLPKDTGVDYAENAFITTDDFDSVSDFTFYASFRIYFDSVAAGGARRRRLLARDVQVPAPALRQSATQDHKTNAALTVPRQAGAPETTTPTATPVPQPATPVAATTESYSLPLVIGLSVGVTLLATSCCWLIVAFAVRRRQNKRKEEDAAVQKLMAAYTSVDGVKPPAWGASAV